jgi:hypothetical protein
MELCWRVDPVIYDDELPLLYVREVTGLSEYDGYALAMRFQQN